MNIAFDIHSSSQFGWCQVFSSLALGTISNITQDGVNHSKNIDNVDPLSMNRSAADV
jgi:hypothetical protein